MLYRNENGVLIIKKREPELTLSDFFEFCETVEEVEELADAFRDAIDSLEYEFIEKIEWEYGNEE